MSAKHPIISVTGSSGAGTTSVRRTFEHIFRREEIGAAFIEGDAFHRFDRDEMRRVMSDEEQRGNNHFSHFGPAANLLEELESVFRTYAETGHAKTRHYVHDAIEADLYRGTPGQFTDWGPLPAKIRSAFLRRPARRDRHGQGECRALCRSQDWRRAGDQSRMGSEDPSRQGGARLFQRKPSPTRFCGGCRTM